MSTQGEDDLPRRGRPKSGSARPLTKCLTRSLVDGYPVTLLNYKSKLIIKLDDNAIRFASIAFIDLVAPQLQVDGIDVEPGQHEEQSEFRFNEETPNIMGKVTWDVVNDSWKVTYKTTEKESCTAVHDADGNSFALPDELDPAERRRRKLHLYKSACATWNALDNSKRQRIVVLSGSTKIRKPEMP